MVVDTNVIVRFLAQDDIQQAERARALFQKTTKRLVIPDLVFAEVFWVMRTVYNVDTNRIIEPLLSLIRLKQVYCNQKVLELTFHHLLNNKSFIDAYIAAFTQIHDDGVIVSFDKGISKIEGITRKEP